MDQKLAYLQGFFLRAMNWLVIQETQPLVYFENMYLCTSQATCLIMAATPLLRSITETI